MKQVTIKELKQKVGSSSKPVFVKFYTDWCGVCKVNAPIIADVEKKYKDKIEFVEVDADHEKAWDEDGNKEFDIKLVPTYYLYVEGKPVWVKNNFVPAPVLEEVFKQNKIAA